MPFTEFSDGNGIAKEIDISANIPMIPAFGKVDFLRGENRAGVIYFNLDL